MPAAPGVSMLTTSQKIGLQDRTNYIICFKWPWDRKANLAGQLFRLPRLLVRTIELTSRLSDTGPYRS
eukprot:3895597-Alexandrium_andersonii.AAC.1